MHAHDDLIRCKFLYLQDKLPSMVLEEGKGRLIVRELILRLAEEQEVLWIEEIIGEFISTGAQGACALLHLQRIHVRMAALRSMAHGMRKHHGWHVCL